MDMPTIISVLDDHGFADTTTTRKVAAINDTYWDICSRESWPFLEKSMTLTFNGTSSVPTNLPTDIAQVTSVVDTINGLSLYPTRLEEIRQRWPLSQTDKGIAFLYYFIAGQLNVFPIPPSTQTYLFTYIKVPAALTSTSVETDIAIPPRWHSLLWYGALAELYDMEDSPEQSFKAETRFEKKYQLMRYQAWTLQTDAADTIAITDYEDLWD